MLELNSPYHLVILLANSGAMDKIITKILRYSLKLIVVHSEMREMKSLHLMEIFHVFSLKTHMPTYPFYLLA